MQAGLFVPYDDSSLSGIVYHFLYMVSVEDRETGEKQQWESAVCVRLPSTENCLQTGCVFAQRGTVPLPQPNTFPLCSTVMAEGRSC